MTRLLLPLIPEPYPSRNVAKKALKRLAAAKALYTEVQRLGEIIHELDAIAVNPALPIEYLGGDKLRTLRVYFVNLQHEFASDLRAAGAPMEGVIWKDTQTKET